MKAMILSAGRGDRMQPLTSTTPKPLMRVGNTTLIEHALNALKQAGIGEVVINVHHLRDQIMQHCGDGSTYGMTIRYSIEETLLDTGGGIFNALPLLGDAPFLVVSADVWTDYPLSHLTEKSVDAAHLVLVDNPAYHPTGDFHLNENNRVQSKGLHNLTYASFGVFHPDLFLHAKPGIFRLTDVLNPAITKGIVTGERYGGEWHNVGTIRDLELLRDNYEKIRASQ